MGYEKELAIGIKRVWIFWIEELEVGLNGVEPKDPKTESKMDLKYKWVEIQFI